MGIGVWQIVLILVVVLIVFGAGKLPRVMGDVGAGMKNFKDGIKGEGDDDNDDKPAIDKSDSADSAVKPKKIKKVAKTKKTTKATKPDDRQKFNCTSELQFTQGIDS